jgi:hypothetical protein
MFRRRLQTSVLIEAGSGFAAAMLADVRVGSMLSKKSQSAEELISRRKAKQAAIAIRWLLSSTTEVVGKFTV